MLPFHLPSCVSHPFHQSEREGRFPEAFTAIRPIVANVKLVTDAESELIVVAASDAATRSISTSVTSAFVVGHDQLNSMPNAS